MSLEQETRIIGNVGRDPEMRYLQNGTPVCSASVAVSKRWTNAVGEQQEKTTWYRITGWRKTAELMNTLLRKGVQVAVTGEMEPARAYLDNAGQPAAQLELTVDQFRLLGKREAQGNEPEAGESGNGGSNTEDIPF